MTNINKETLNMLKILSDDDQLLINLLVKKLIKHKGVDYID